MLRFSLIAISFAFLGAAFYEMSGGDDFDAEELRLSRIETPELSAPEQEPDSRLAAVDTSTSEVSRVSLNLTSLGEVMRPERTLRTTPARERSEPDAQVFAASASADDTTGEIERPSVTIPSLIPGATPEDVDAGVVITSVDLSGEPARRLPGTSARDVREVTGSRVNVRGGPGTGFSVVNSLSRGAEVIVLDDPGDGWVQLRPADGGPVGWMADFLLTDAS